MVSTLSRSPKNALCFLMGKKNSHIFIFHVLWSFVKPVQKFFLILAYDILSCPIICKIMPLPLVIKNIEI